MSVRNIVKSIQDIMRQDSGVDGDAQRISQLCWMFFLKIIDDQDKELELLDKTYRSPIPKRFQWRTWAANPEGITGDELLTFVNAELFPAFKNLTVSPKPGDRRRVVKGVFEDAYNYMKSGQLMRQVINKINGVDFNSLTDRQHFGDIYEQVLNDLQSAGNAGEYYTPRAVTAFMVDRIDPHPGEVLFDPSCGTGGFLTCAIRHMRERYVKKSAQETAMQGAGPFPRQQTCRTRKRFLARQVPWCRLRELGGRLGVGVRGRLLRSALHSRSLRVPSIGLHRFRQVARFGAPLERRRRRTVWVIAFAPSPLPAKLVPSRMRSRRQRAE